MVKGPRDVRSRPRRVKGLKVLRLTSSGRIAARSRLCPRRHLPSLRDASCVRAVESVIARARRSVRRCSHSVAVGEVGCVFFGESASDLMFVLPKRKFSAGRIRPLLAQARSAAVSAQRPLSGNQRTKAHVALGEHKTSLDSALRCAPDPPVGGDGEIGNANY